MQKRLTLLLAGAAVLGLVLLGESPRPADSDPVANPAAVAAVAPERLSRAGLTPEEYAFKQEVYRLHVARGVQSGRARIYDLPAADLATVPGTQIVMRKDAAQALGRLLSAARADLAADVAATGTDAETADRRARAGQVQELALNNAYRSASTQFAIWDRNFQKYLADTAAQRKALDGGEYGPAAAAFLRDYVGVRVAAPGFSNHQGGTAVDFALRLKPSAGGPRELDASTAQSNPWKESWFWRWLNRRAGEFGFIPYLPEPWHWEYAPDRKGQGRT